MIKYAVRKGLWFQGSGSAIWRVKEVKAEDVIAALESGSGRIIGEVDKFPKWWVKRQVKGR